jgi:hypothetical protein
MSGDRNEPPFDSDETFGARLMRESIEDNEARRAEERMEPPFVSNPALAASGDDSVLPDLARAQPDPPTGVHIVRLDGTTLPCELTYNGTNPDGAHEWVIAGAVIHTGDTIRIATLPARAAIAFFTDSDKHPRATWSAMDE